MIELPLPLHARTHDVGGVAVRRALPERRCRAVGPFVFLDQMGPTTFAAGRGIDVAPHPHIGLSTLTFLFEGELEHRDSLGVRQRILPGEVNWMTAGRGVAHSERTPAPLRAGPSRLFGVQTWVALPRAEEERAPSFEHHGADALPAWDEEGVAVTLAAGSWAGRRSPVGVFQPLVEALLAFAAGAEHVLGDDHAERAVYVADGRLVAHLDDVRLALEVGDLLVLPAGARPRLVARAPARAVLVGGAPLDAPRTIHWNFVASSKARIAAARDAWADGAWPVPGDDERLPLPASTLP